MIGLYYCYTEAHFHTGLVQGFVRNTENTQLQVRIHIKQDVLIPEFILD